MPVRLTESKIPDGLVADDLGQAVQNGDYMLVSYLTQPLHYEEGKKALSNKYVVFDTGNTSEPSTYRWKFEFEVEGETNVIELAGLEGQEGGSVFITNSEDSVFAGSLEGNKVIKITTTVSLDVNATTELVLEQTVEGLDQKIEDLIDNAENEKGANAGEPATTRKIANDYKIYLLELEKNLGDSLLEKISLNLLTTLLYQAIENDIGIFSSYPDNIYDSMEKRWVNYINGDGGIDYKDLIGSKFGILNAKPHVSYFTNIIEPVTNTSYDGYVFDSAIENIDIYEERLLQEIDLLSPSDKVDLFNRLRFPKTCLYFIWEALLHIKERRSEFRSIVLDEINHPNNKICITTIVTEYEEAPQDNIPKLSNTSKQAYDVMYSQWMQAILDKEYFEIYINLVSDSEKRLLTPFSVFDYDEISSGTTNNKPEVKFQFEVRWHNVDSVDFVVTVEQSGVAQEIYRETTDPALLVIGVHDWYWDGFDNNQILDTTILKDQSLTLTVDADLNGVIKKKKIEFENSSAEFEWVDLRIDKTAQHIDVTLRVNIQDGGENGVGDTPTQEAITEHNLTSPDPRLLPHARIRSFSQLQTLALDGIRICWSRDTSNGHNVNLVDGTTVVTYDVTVIPQQTDVDAMDDIDVEYNTNGDWGRSSNPGGVRGIYSFVANIFVPERTIYNVGWIRYDDVPNCSSTTLHWEHVSPVDADNEFKLTFAHELGHEILSSYGGENYSYGHKGTSSVITQEPISTTPGAVAYPAMGEIDLMKYYYGCPNSNPVYTNSVVNMEDVKSLLWLARIQFDEK